MKQRHFLGWLGVGMLALSAVSCITDVASVDYWSQVIAACDYQMSGGFTFSADPATRLQTSLRPACREALEAILPFDESFNSAPEGMKEHVLEAFQILAAYPLALPPENRIFGVAPGAIPAATLCIVGSSRCPSHLRPTNAGWELGNYRKNVFNAVVNSFESIRFELDPGAYASNQNHLSAGINGRSLVIHEPFWKQDDSEDILRGPFDRAATLVHEAWHSQGSAHQLCPSDGSDGALACDPDLRGAYGASVVYHTMLLHGSGSLRDSTGRPILSGLDLTVLAYQSCIDLRDKILYLPSELRALVDATSCGAINSQWVISHEKPNRASPKP